MKLNKNDKILIFGSNGMVGSAIIRKLELDGYTNIKGIHRKICDLTRQSDVEALMHEEKADYVFVASAKVGGIHANSTYPAEFHYENLMIQSNIIHSAYLSKVKKLLFLGSTCIYPKMAPQPLKEESLLTSPLEPTNEAYALAKISGLKMCDYYYQQYGCQFVSAMPTNLYGYGDNFHPENSHVIPGLMLRFHEAKQSNAESVYCWGTGSPLREFLFIDDLADALVFTMENFEGPGFVNAGTAEEVSIKELSELIAEVVGYKGQLDWDHSKPDGTPRKITDMSKLHDMGWKHQTGLREGLEKTYAWFLENEETLRR